MRLGKVGPDQVGDAAETFQRVGVLPPRPTPPKHPQAAQPLAIRVGTGMPARISCPATSQPAI